MKISKIEFEGSNGNAAIATRKGDSIEVEILLKHPLVCRGDDGATETYGTRVHHVAAGDTADIDSMAECLQDALGGATTRVERAEYFRMLNSLSGPSGPGAIAGVAADRLAALRHEEIGPGHISDHGGDGTGEGARVQAQTERDATDPTHLTIRTDPLSDGSRAYALLITQDDKYGTAARRIAVEINLSCPTFVEAAEVAHDVGQLLRLNSCDAIRIG